MRSNGNGKRKASVGDVTGIRTLHGLSRRLLGCAAALIAAGCGASEAAPGDAVTVGLLLPFTGTSSAVASNFERAVLYAADRINEGGGIHGHRLEVVAGDTHSDLARSLESTARLIEAGAVVVIGPESADIAEEIAPLLVENGVAFLSPLIGAANDATVDCTHPWFRLAPSARSLGEALAKKLSSERVEKAAVLFAAGAYNEALRDAVTNRFRALGGSVELELELDPSAQSYADVISRATAANVGAVVLATSPRTGALVVNEFDALSATPPRWFLSPLLKTELLVQNVAPEALEGAIGVAPKIYDDANDFPLAFSTRWAGDKPLEGAYFYYDALGLLAFALQRAPLRPDRTYELQSLEQTILDAAAPPGEAAGWDDVEVGLERLRSGDDIYYSGLTGPVLLEDCGSRRLGATTVWKVQSGAIVNLPE